jgi:hypothetical protein
MADTNINPPTLADKERAAWQLLNAQISHFEQAARWEPWKALAAIIGAGALMTAAVIALSNWHTVQRVEVNFGQPLTVQLQPAKGD